MRTLNWYLDTAKQLNGFKSDRELGRALPKATQEMVSRYRSGKAYPSPETMVAISGLAGVSPELGLADLGYWTNFDNEAATVYERMSAALEKARHMAAALVLPIGIGMGAVTLDPQGMAQALEPVNATGTTHQVAAPLINYACFLYTKTLRLLPRPRLS